MAQMRVLRLVLYAPTQEPVLLLGEQDGDRCLPVFLRRPQAEVISAGRREQQGPPLVQDVLARVVEALGSALAGVEITALHDGVYRADLILAEDVRVSVLPSDALAIAVREGLPIAVADEVLDAAGQPVAEILPAGAEHPPQQQLEDFQQFLDDVSPEDFDR